MQFSPLLHVPILLWTLSLGCTEAVGPRLNDQSPVPNDQEPGFYSIEIDSTTWFLTPNGFEEVQHSGPIAVHAFKGEAFSNGRYLAWDGLPIASAVGLDSINGDWSDSRIVAIGVEHGVMIQLKGYGIRKCEHPVAVSRHDVHSTSGMRQVEHQPDRQRDQ